MCAKEVPEYYKLASNIVSMTNLVKSPVAVLAVTA